MQLNASTVMTRVVQQAIDLADRMLKGQMGPAVTVIEGQIPVNKREQLN